MSQTEKTYKLLIINPGSTSTKVSLFENERALFERSLFHDAPVLLKFPHVNDQIPFRYQVILDMLAEEKRPQLILLDIQMPVMDDIRTETSVYLSHFISLLF